MIGANQDIISSNLYAYVSCNPIINTDSGGLFLSKLVDGFTNCLKDVTNDIKNTISDFFGYINASIQETVSSSKTDSWLISRKQEIYYETPVNNTNNKSKSVKYSSKTSVRDKQSVSYTGTLSNKKGYSIGVTLGSDALSYNINNISFGYSINDFSWFFSTSTSLETEAGILTIEDGIYVNRFQLGITILGAYAVLNATSIASAFCGELIKAVSSLPSTIF